MSSSTWQDWATIALRPQLSTVIITFIIALTLPLLLHLYIYRSRASTQLPAFLIAGPSGSGKTALTTFFERGTPAQTHTSQTSLTVQCSLPVEARAASDKYRSVNDPTNKAHKNFLLIDTPGHGKLRHFALDSINNPLHLKGIIFVVDAATLSEDSEGTRSLTENAQYLHDMLHILQTKHTSAKTSKGSSEIPVLVAANKLDLFTALPTKLVRKSLEAEITKLRNTKSKGLIDSGVGMNDDELDDPEVLGGNGEGKFEFKLMEEYNIPIEVAGGSVTSAEGPDTDAWWDWIARHL